LEIIPNTWSRIQQQYDFNRKIIIIIKHSQIKKYNL
jgi:hypothetical protein